MGPVHTESIMLEILVLTYKNNPDKLPRERTTLGNKFLN